MPAKNVKGRPKTDAVACRSRKNQNIKNVVENIKLCAIVQQYPQLYNSEHKDSLRQKPTVEAWQAVAAAWGKTAPKCKIRWRNLRAAYARSIDAYTTQRGPNRRKPYYLTKHMEFLRPYLHKEATAVVAENVADVISVAESVALEPSTIRAWHSTTAKENQSNDLFMQNIQRQMQGMNQTQKETLFADILKKITFAFAINIMEEQELRDLQRKIQDRLNQSDDDEVLVVNEPLSPDSY